MLDLVDLVLNLDRYMDEVIRANGTWTYAILFIVVFLETGLVLTPFLPGDSLIFVMGAFCAVGTLEVEWVATTLTAAAIAGDTANYHIGQLVGQKILLRSRFINRQHLDRTQLFFEKHGGKTIILARFIPLIRTFAPFVAGLGKMTYWRFLSYNIIGAVAWVVSLIALGYFFGNIPGIKDNYMWAILFIVLVSLTPVAGNLLNKHRRKHM